MITLAVAALAATNPSVSNPKVAFTATLPVTRPHSAANDIAAKSIAYLADRAQREPDNFAVQNRLAGYLLQRARETGSVEDLFFARRAATASLAAVAAERNRTGLAALAQAEFAVHDFLASRDHARRLIQLDSTKSESYAMLADSLIELGDYAGADEALKKMQALQVDDATFVGETRLARMAALRGRTDPARSHYLAALSLALDVDAPSPEAVAWCQWQLGETEFGRGHHEAAETHYADALNTLPGYFRALASMGRVRAARNDWAGAIEHYEQAIRILPDPTFVAALGDLYQLTGRTNEAAQQYALVEAIGRLSAANGILYNRQLAMFYADHDLNADRAYAAATEEYKTRRDVYGADAVAWTALKAKKLNDARAAMAEAMRLGTQDARLLYHAGMIARAGGNRQEAKQHLNAALKLNPNFDPLQSPLARKALEE